jgi:hypothetical protein
MIEPQPSVSYTVERVRAWLSANDRGRWRMFAVAAGVDEKTLRLAVRKKWNPTYHTLQKLEALIPPGWQPGDPVPKPKAAAQQDAAA